MIIDVAECTNCNLCTLATMDEYVDNDWPGYSAPMPKHGHKWIDIKQKERGQTPFMDIAYMPTMCNHCDDAPCIKAAPDVISKRGDGIVLIDPVKSRGRKDLVDACPYGHIWWNEDLDIPQAWTFDAHLLDTGWDKTRGHQSCPTGAMKAIKLDDDAMAKLAKDEGLEVLQPELGTKPRIWYRNLWRYTTAFIGGSVSSEAGGLVDCVEGATVTLSKDSGKIAETTTDTYGDFKFDKLAEGSGAYTIDIMADGYKAKSIETELDRSIYLGEVRIN